MRDLPEAPNGANDERPPWKPSNPDRWGILGLADSKPDARLPEQGDTADVLAWAFMSASAEDPIEGILEAVRVELLAHAETLSPHSAQVEWIGQLCRKLDAAVLLLRRCDNRVPSPPVEPLVDEPPLPSPPEPPPERKRSRRAT